MTTRTPGNRPGRRALHTAGLVLSLLFLPAQVLQACTVFLVSGEGRVLAGNNEDYRNPFTRVWFVPAKDGAYGRVCFGFDNGFTQGGMNEKGLFFDGLATAPLAVKRSGDKPRFKGNIMEAVLSRCATVKEALAFLDRYSLKGWERFQIFFGDATGDAAVVEGDEVIRKKGRFLLCTNFHLSRAQEKGITCSRYRIAQAKLRPRGPVDVALCRSVLAAVHQEGANPTQYSNVYDLKNKLVYLYHFHNFENVVVLDLDAELKKGARALDIASLFARNYAAEVYRAAQEKKLKARRKALRAAKVDPGRFDALEGAYRLEEGGVIKIFRWKDGLFAMTPTSPPIPLVPRGRDRFVAVSYDGDLNVDFESNDAGKAVALKLSARGRSFRAVRIE
jgi:hypothetical protein